MRYFPQLATHTAGQYPLRRVLRERVVRHESRDGRLRSYYDGSASRVEWILRYHDLTTAERAAVESLFDECEGRLQTFVFLDPAANLLRWSEDYLQPAWVKEPMLSVSSGEVDPWGTQRATNVTNGGAGPQMLSQMIEAPGSLQYCLSVYARGAGQRFRLRVDSGGVVVHRDFVGTAEWRRYSLPAQPSTAAETVTFGVTIDPGQQVALCGLQADAQPSPGGYRRTTTRSGVFANARFATDVMAWQQQAPNNHAAEIRIESRS